MSNNIDTFDQLSEFQKFSGFAKKAIIEAFENARVESAENVDLRHLFLALMNQKKSIARRLLEKLGVDIFETQKALISYNLQPPSKNKAVKFGEDVKKALVDALVIASDLGHVYAGTEHILLSILRFTKTDFVNDLINLGISYETVKEALLSFATYHQGVFGNKPANQDADQEEDEGESALSAFSEDLNEKEKLGMFLPVYGRDEEIERIIHILSRKTKSNPILVGEAGVGKTAVIEGLVQRLNEKNVPISFQNKRIVSLDIAGILAGSKIRGDVEERILDVIREASNNKDIVLFIDEIHMIVGAGSAGQGSMDIANILKPHLTSGQISVIGATTLDEYQQYFESESALSRRFQPVYIKEIGKEEAINVLKNIREKLEEFHGVSISDKAIEVAVDLSQKYIHDRYLPDKAIDIIDEAAAGQKISKDNKSGKYFTLKRELEQMQRMKADALENNQIAKASNMRKKEVSLLEKMDKITKDRAALGKQEYVVDEDSVRKVVSRLSKVPVEKMGRSTVNTILGLEEAMNKNIIGQEDAVKRVVSGIKRAKVGIGDMNRPLASFIFIGPSGVGKTEMAKVLATELFGHEDSLIQVNMSEYMEPHSVSKLIGSPPGYIGFQEGGQFTEKIRRNPYCVVLLDEIEKAHPDLLNIWLQILDEGTVKDAKGRYVSFKNTIIIMTSNLGVKEIAQDGVLGFNLDSDTSNDPSKKEIEKAYENMRSRLMDKLKEEMKPEFLNRIDDIIVFKGLTDTDIRKIVKLEIEKLNKRISENGFMVAVTPGVIDYIANTGMSKDYGARNIKRKIQELIENPLANLVLEKGLVDTSKTYIVRTSKTKNGIELKLEDK